MRPGHVKIRTRLALAASLVILLALGATVLVASSTIRENTDEEIDRYRTEQVQMLVKQLQGMVDLEYFWIEDELQEARESADYQRPGPDRDKALTTLKTECYKQIQRFRIAGGQGWLWSTGEPPPFPNDFLDVIPSDARDVDLNQPPQSRAGKREPRPFAFYREKCQGPRWLLLAGWAPWHDGPGQIQKLDLACLRYFKPLDWLVGATVDGSHILRTIDQKMEAMHERLQQLLWHLVGAALVITLATIVLSFVSVRSLTRPIDVLIRAMKTVKDDPLSRREIQTRGPPETRELGTIFNAMLASIQEASHELARTQSAQERIQAELAVARQVQMSLLPVRFPPSPELPAVELHATLQPAREVGGDLYDFFAIDASHFFFVVGDVSSKGVPAALFMAITKALFPLVARSGSTSGSIVTKLNAELIRNNPTCMFVTLLCGVLELSTGRLVYTNAGHNPPMLIRNSGEVVLLDERNGPLVGAMPDRVYSSSELMLGSGDRLLLYTDGVTEAMNERHEVFSEERLYDVGKRHPAASPRELVEQVIREVNLFVGQAEPSDDITLLALQYEGKNWCEG